MSAQRSRLLGLLATTALVGAAAVAARTGVQPGAFATEIGSKSTRPDDPARAAAYGPESLQVAKNLSNGLAAAAQGRDPGDVARAILRLANLPNDQRPLRTTVPNDAIVESINDCARRAQKTYLDSLDIPWAKY